MKKTILLILTLISFNAISQKIKLSESVVEMKDHTSIMVFGDWGRNGEFHQKDLAKAMGKIAERIDPEFIISTGDNFYPNGVESVHDPLWRTSFEDIYSAHSLQLPWYVVLGNHDYRGSIEAEIEYTKISRRWNMPEEYFSFEQELEDGSKALFVFLDTNPLNDEYYSEAKYASKVAQKDTLKQLNWLRKTLSESTAQTKIVAGHHPMYTGGKRIDDPNYIQGHLEDIFETYKVDVYVAGHEHDLQLIKPEGHTYHIVSGAGSEVRKTGFLENTVFAKSEQGVALLHLSANDIILQFVNYKGKEIFAKKLK